MIHDLQPESLILTEQRGLSAGLMMTCILAGMIHPAFGRNAKKRDGDIRMTNRIRTAKYSVADNPKFCHESTQEPTLP